MKQKKGIAFLWIALVVFAGDLATKALVLIHFSLYQTEEILPIFNLTYVRNYGAAFSFLADHSGWQKFLFIALALAVSALLCGFLWKNPYTARLQNIAYSLILGGALGNCADRIYHGFVVDFLDFHWQDWHYPVFNVADIAIFVGVVLLVFEGFYSAKDEQKIERNEK